MSLLNSKFDITSVDNPMALAALAQVLAVDSPAALGINGTPTAGTIEPGAIVCMNASGKAVLATTPTVSAANPKLVFVTLDGDVDYSGSFVQKLTVLHGGFTMVTDQFEAGSYSPGDAVTFNGGKIAVKVFGDHKQIIGFVGPAGKNVTDATLEVIVPQGAGLTENS